MFLFSMLMNINSIMCDAKMVCAHYMQVERMERYRTFSSGKRVSRKLSDDGGKW